MRITIETQVAAPIEVAWSVWTTPAHITQWNMATEEWCCPRAVNDLRAGGSFCYRMEARDGSMGFDFEGRYVRVLEHRLLEYTLGDDRSVSVEFLPAGDGVTVRESFDAENEMTAEQQRQGWQGILDRFAAYAAGRHAETHGGAERQPRLSTNSTPTSAI